MFPENIFSDPYKFSAVQNQCERSHLFFTRFFFKIREAKKFIVNWHHQLIADTIDDVITGRKKNVVITVSPGSSKTELVVINFIARGLAINPRARFLHLSGSDTLASLNSATARDIVASEEFQKFWPLRIMPDEKSKKRWNIQVDGHKAGGVYATSLGGQITGFRAGHMAEGFQGAILIDDPIKPEDAFSRNKLDTANRTLLTTVKSRKANPDTPIILIMQRIAESDPVGFIQKGNVDGHWDVIRIPAIIDNSYLDKLPDKYQNMIELSETVDNRFSYWPYKEPIQDLLKMERGEGKDQTGQRISRHVYASQYDQNPVALGGNIIRGEWFKRFTVLPKIKWRIIIADTAQKTKERNDYSVFGEMGLGVDGFLYFLDLIRGKWEAPELQKRAVSFWLKAKSKDIEHFGNIRKMQVEDKSSGTGLIQTLKLPPYLIPIEGIERGKDKLTRVMDSIPYLECGQVFLPEDGNWVHDFISECEAFTADDSHDHDDMVDVLCDGVDAIFSFGNKLKLWESLGNKGK